GGGGARRSDGAEAAEGRRPGVADARAADAGRLRRLPQGRSREVVADHQGCEHQARGLKTKHKEFAMRKWLCACVLLLAAIGGATAQPYPNRPITLVVPLGVGGSTDVIGRIMAEGMRQHIGQPIVVENTTGAGGTIGVGRVARATPDGYTILIGQWGTNVA